MKVEYKYEIKHYSPMWISKVILFVKKMEECQKDNMFGAIAYDVNMSKNVILNYLKEKIHLVDKRKLKCAPNFKYKPFEKFILLDFNNKPIFIITN